MKRLVSTAYSSGKIMGVVFQQERRGAVYVGVAVVTDEVAEKFEGREEFDIEDLDVSEVHEFPTDFPLLAPQKAALVRAGLNTLDAVRAHDFKATPVTGIADKTVLKIQEFFAPTPPAPPAAPVRGRSRSGSGKDAPQAPAPKPDEGKPADPPAE